MKNLLLIAALTLITINAQAACELTLKVKKPTSKTYYLTSGEKITERYKDKLATVCKINVSVMSEQTLKDLKVAELERKLAKLKAN